MRQLENGVHTEIPTALNIVYHNTILLSEYRVTIPVVRYYRE